MPAWGPTANVLSPTIYRRGGDLQGYPDPSVGHSAASDLRGVAGNSGMGGRKRRNPHLISWRVDAKARHGEIYLLAVSPLHQRQHIGERLCQHAIAHMRADKVEVVQISTGGDPFHAPARALYERLGFTLVPVAVYLGVI